MRHPGVRWTVLVLAVTAAAGLGYRVALLEQQGAAARRALLATTGEAVALQSALSDVRRAMAAMASPGQPTVSWSRQVNAAIGIARSRLTRLAAVPSGAALAASGERLDRLVEAEGRLHESAVGGRSLMASDIAFGEALPHVDAIDKQITDVVSRLNADADRSVAAARQQQALAAAGALGVVALAAVILTPLPRRRGEDAAAPTVEPEPLAARDLSLDLGRAARSLTAADAPRAATSNLDMAALAAACSELARLSDGTALAAVLERVAPAIGAKGIVVWLASADRSVLQPAAAWGYDPRLVSRFPTVAAGDDNPTAHAFSNAAPATVPGRSGQPAAVAAPIVSAQGAVGVLSVELTSTGTPAPSLVAAAGIVAAQLATLLEPVPSGETSAADPAPAAQG